MKYLLIAVCLLPVFAGAAETDEETNIGILAHKTTLDLRWKSAEMRSVSVKKITFSVALLEEPKPLWAELKGNYTPREMFPVQRASLHTIPFAVRLQEGNTTLLLRPNRFKLSIAFNAL